MGTRRLESCGRGLDDQPVHERENFVEAGVAVQIGVVEETEAAVAVADVGRGEREAELEVIGAAAVRHTVAILVDVGTRGDIGPPLRHRELFDRGAAVDPDRRHQAVEHQVVPLVEHGELEVTRGQIAEHRQAIRVALGEREVLAVRRADGDVALREVIRVVSTAAVDALVGRAAHSCARHLYIQRGIAGQTPAVGLRIADARAGGIGAPVFDDLRVGEADRDVEAAGAELLEVAGFVGLDERLVRLAAVERVGLQPFFAARDAVGRGRGDDFIQPRVQVGDDRLACQWRERQAVGFVLRAGRNHADQTVAPRRDRAGIQVGDWVDLARQRVRHRVVEHVVGDLAGVVTEAAGLVEQLDLETAETRLVRRDHVDTAAGIVLAVERVVVLEHEHRDLGRGQRGLLQHDVDWCGGRRCDLRQRDLRATHRMAAKGRVSVGVAEIARLPPGVGRVVGPAVPGDVERHVLAVDRLRPGTTNRRVDTVTRQNRDEVALARVEVNRTRQNRGLLRDAGAASAVTNVARHGNRLLRLPELARDRADAALCDYRHVGGVEAVAEALDRQRRAAVRSQAACADVGGVDLARGVDPERPVFFDDPAVVVDRAAVQGVLDVDGEVRRGEKHHRGVGRIARGSLRILRLILEGHAGRSSRRSGREPGAGSCGARPGRRERPVGVQACSDNRGERESAGARHACEHAWGRGCVARRDVAGELHVRRYRRGSQAGTRASGQCDRRAGGACGRAVAAIAERRRRARIRERPIGTERESGRGRSRNGDPVDAHVIAHHTLGRVRNRERNAAADDVVGVGNGHGSRGRGARAGTARGTAGDIDVRLHTTIALVAGGQAELAVEHRVSASVVGTRRGLLGLYRHVVGLARGHEHRVLHSGIAGHLVAVLGDERHARADHGRHVHAQARVDHAQHHACLRAGGGHGRHGQRGRGGAVERDTVNQVVQRTVVDRRRVAGVRDTRSGVRVATFAGRAVPHLGVAESGCVHRRGDRGVLHRVDFAQQQRNVLVEGDVVRLRCRHR